MLAGSLASSPYIAYTATEYSVLGESPSSRTSGWATFTCQQRDVLGYPSILGYPPTPSTETFQRHRSRSLWLHGGDFSTLGLHHLGKVLYSGQCSAFLPKGHRAPWGYTSPSPTLVCRGGRPLYRDAAVVVLGWMKGRVRDVTPLRSDTGKALAEELPAVGRSIGAGLLPPAANAARPQLSSRSALAAETRPRDLREAAHHGAQLYKKLGTF